MKVTINLNLLFVLILIILNSINSEFKSLKVQKSLKSSLKSSNSNNSSDCKCTEDKLILIFNAYSYKAKEGPENKNGFKTLEIPKENKKYMEKYFHDVLPECVEFEQAALKEAFWLIYKPKKDVYVLSIVVNKKRVIIFKGTDGMEAFVKLLSNFEVKKSKDFTGDINKYALNKNRIIKHVLDDFLAKVPENKLILSGHSQGGANSYAYAAYLFNKGNESKLLKKFDDISIVNFAGMFAGDDKLDMSFCKKIHGRNYITSSILNEKNDKQLDFIYFLNKGDVNMILFGRKQIIADPYNVNECKANFKQLYFSVTPASKGVSAESFEVASKLERKICKVNNKFIKNVKRSGNICKAAKGNKWFFRAFSGLWLHPILKYAEGISKFNDVSECLV